MTRAHGFSLVELLVAMVVTLGVTGALFAMLDPSSSTFLAQAEVADMQQRARVAANALARDLAMSGAGAPSGRQVEPLNRFLAPIVPYSAGEGGDRPGAFRADAISLTFVPPAFAQAVISSATPARSGVVTVDTGSGCVPVGSLCGFTSGMSVLLYDAAGFHDRFTVSSISGSVLDLRHDSPDSGHVYAAGSSIVEATHRTYSLRPDPATGADQLTRTDGGSEAPLVDHVVGLSFEYFGDPQPPRILPPQSAIEEPSTTYGPRPPVEGVQTTSYPPGENCVFTYDGAHRSRLVTFGPSGAPLIRLGAEQVTDGPWCPDPLHPTRFDADLLRIRRVAVRVRIQAAIEGLRGPAGRLFTRGGTARAGSRFVPDLEIRFQVAPANLDFSY